MIKHYRASIVLLFANTFANELKRTEKPSLEVCVFHSFHPVFRYHWIYDIRKIPVDQLLEYERSLWYVLLPGRELWHYVNFHWVFWVMSWIWWIQLLFIQSFLCPKNSSKLSNHSNKQLQNLTKKDQRNPSQLLISRAGKRWIHLSWRTHKSRRESIKFCEKISRDINHQPRIWFQADTFVELACFSMLYDDA